jgi:hypothetical protein
MHHDSPALQDAQQATMPVWDGECGLLFLGGEIILRFDKPAQNQRAILDEFQRQGWRNWIKNPLAPDEHMDERQRLADAVHRLNRGQKELRIRFRRDGRGLGIVREILPKKIL